MKFKYFLKEPFGVKGLQRKSLENVPGGERRRVKKGTADQQQTVVSRHA